LGRLVHGIDVIAHNVFGIIEINCINFPLYCQVLLLVANKFADKVLRDLNDNDFKGVLQLKPIMIAIVAGRAQERMLEHHVSDLLDQACEKGELLEGAYYLESHHSSPCAVPENLKSWHALIVIYVVRDGHIEN